MPKTQDSTVKIMLTIVTYTTIMLYCVYAPFAQVKNFKPENEVKHFLMYLLFKPKISNNFNKEHVLLNFLLMQVMQKGATHYHLIRKYLLLHYKIQ
jgi:hypothetical protein